MAIDFDAIKRKLDRLSGNNNSRNVMWKPTEGEKHTVRLLSFPDNDGQPFKELMFYYNIPGQRGLLAPSQFGKRDPIQELITKLRDDGSKESYELAKKLYPKMRCYAPVIVRGEEDKGVRVWSFGKTVYQSLLNIMLDEDYGDITDVAEGRDVKVICTKAPGRMWATTEVRPRGRSSKLSNNDSQITEWTKNIPSLNDMYELKTYAELEKIVNDWLNGDDFGDDSSNSTGSSAGQSTGTTRNTTNTAATSSTSESGQSDKQYKSLDEAFADLDSF